MTTYTIAGFVFLPKNGAPKELPPGMEILNDDNPLGWVGSGSGKPSGLFSEYLIGIRLFKDEADFKKWQTDHRAEDEKFKRGAPLELIFARRITPLELP
jgi:hypothetical protein